MLSHSLALICLRKGAELLSADELDKATAFTTAGAFFDRAGEAMPFIAALATRLTEKTKEALEFGDMAGAQMHDDFLRVFLPPDVSPIDQDQALDRAFSRIASMQQAYQRNDLASAATHFSAAFALAPEVDPFSGCGNPIHTALTEAPRFNPDHSPTDDTIADFALALRIEARPGTQLALAKWRRVVNDFPMTLELAEQAADRCETAADQIEAGFIAGIARHRLEGLDAEQAEQRANATAARALWALGSPKALTTDLLVTRSQRTYMKPGISKALKDLREILSRDSASKSEKNYAATLIVSCLRNALYPENQTALEIMEASCNDTDQTVLQLFYSAWTSGAIESTLRLADRLTQWFPPFAIFAPLHRMATDLDLKPVASIGQPQPNKHRVYATVACWGEAYISVMEISTIASLLSPNNFPALAEKADVHLELFTLKENVTRLANSPALQKLADYCFVKIFAYPEEVSLVRGALPFMLLGFGAHSTLLRAERDGADFMNVCADMIFADGSYTAIAKRLSREPLLLLTDHLNAYVEPVMERLEPCFQGVVLNASVSQLLTAASGALSRRSVDQVYRPDDAATPYYPVRTIFQVPGGLAMHSFYCNPLYASHAALSPILKPNFAPPDGVFTEHLLQNARRGRTEMLLADEFLGVEVCKDDGHVFEIRPNPLLKSIKDIFFSTGIPVIRKLVFPYRNFFPGLEVDVARQVSIEEADRVVQSVIDMFETDPLLSDLQAESAAIERAYRDAWRRSPTKQPC
jgi:hypothetical protein